MNPSLLPQQASERIQKAFDRLRNQVPQLANVLDAFEALFVERALLKAELPAEAPSDFSIDPVKFSRGVPIFSRDEFALSPEWLKDAADRLIPAMEKGFPGIGEQLRVIREAIVNSEPEGQSFSSAYQTGIEDWAEKLKVDPATLRFVLFQLEKPFAEKLAESLPPFPEGLEWLKGYCPVCGSWPELGFLEGKEGHRKLRCSFCGNNWGFMRTQCPFCETLDQDKMEIHFAENREFERVELCHECKKYLVSIDLRDRADEMVLEVAPLAMVHLDILAQEKGFSPAAILGWNVIGPT
ncbi:MAG: formate dehydrogenase accessory protein FdhE [Desulfomonile tiedjei]|nr:formate dehydrogenase accessory protein FdhE [Desulfomonile tiedjei]